MEILKQLWKKITHIRLNDSYKTEVMVRFRFRFIRKRITSFVSGGETIDLKYNDGGAMMLFYYGDSKSYATDIKTLESFGINERGPLENALWPKELGLISPGAAE